MKRLIASLLSFVISLSALAQTTKPSRLSVVWWQGQENMDHWVKDLGVNCFWWDSAIHYTAGDWVKAEAKIESLRQQGYVVYEIRQPAPLLVPDKLTIDFDKSPAVAPHLLAYSVVDEREDKVKKPTGGYYSVSISADVPFIVNDFNAMKMAYASWNPAVPLAWNANGTHISAGMKSVYAQLGTGIQYLSSDTYPYDTDQVTVATGQHLWPDWQSNYTTTVTTGASCFKQWFPNATVLFYIGTGNQLTNVAGAPGWVASGPGATKFVGSRAPKGFEAWDYWRTANDKIGANGICYFPQARNGAVNDATDLALYSTIQAIDAEINPQWVRVNLMPTGPPATQPATQPSIHTVTVDGVQYVPQH